MEIKAIPTFLLLSGGTPVDKIVGANPYEIKRRVDHFIQSTLSNKSVVETLKWINDYGLEL